MEMRLIMIMLLTMSLVSCNTQVVCDISFEPEERCRCRCYDLDSLKTVNKIKCENDWDKYFGGTPESHPINLDIRACEGIMGVRVEEIAKDVIPEVKEERARCEDME